MSLVTAISTSDRKGVRKNNTDTALLVEDLGIKDDAHAGQWHRQVSFLAQESIDFMRDKGLDVVAGNFAENLTTTGINLTELEVGRHIHIGKCEMIISQLGKICHNRCAIYHQAGDCVMPREGIFGVVVQGGEIQINDEIVVTDKVSQSCAIITETSVAKDIEYSELKELDRVLNTGFTRIDTLNGKKDNLKAIIADLTKAQKISHIFFYDPQGDNRFIFDQEPKEQNIHYCTSRDEMMEIASNIAA